MPVYDRFIPVRSAMNLDLFDIWPPNGKAATAATTSPSTEYRRRLKYFAFGDRRRFLAFKSNGFSQDDDPIPSPPRCPPPATSFIPRLSHVDDFPLRDDWPLSAMDWGSNTLLAMGTRNRVYLLDPDEFRVIRLLSAPDEFGRVTSLAWSPNGSILAVGFSESMVQLCDLETSGRVNVESMGGGAVTSLCWNGNGICTFGREDGAIVNCDLFSGVSVSRFGEGHASSVCRLRWSPGGTQLASGSTDGLLRIWDGNTGRNLHKFRDDKSSSGAPISGFVWSPSPCRSNLLAAAAGRSVELWNTATGSCIRACATASRVTGLVWSPGGSGLVSSHWCRANQFTIWKCNNKSLIKIDDNLNDIGKSRILSMCQSAGSDQGRVMTLEANGHSLHCWRISESHETNRDREAKANAREGIAFRSCIRYIESLYH